MKKLKLSKQTIRSLAGSNLREARGGADSIVYPTQAVCPTAHETCASCTAVSDVCLPTF